MLHLFPACIHASTALHFISSRLTTIADGFSPRATVAPRAEAKASLADWEVSSRAYRRKNRRWRVWTEMRGEEGRRSRALTGMVLVKGFPSANTTVGHNQSKVLSLSPTFHDFIANT